MWNPDDEKVLKRKHEAERLCFLQRQRESVEVAARKALIQKLKASRKYDRSQMAIGSPGWAAGAADARGRADLANRFMPKQIEAAKTGAVLRSSVDQRGVNAIRAGLIAALGKRF